MIGQTISHYQILEKLGEGGMGVVYKAEDTKLKRTVALKFLSPQAVGTEEDKSRFVHEAQAAAALNHNNICTIHEIDEHEGQPFIAMEFIEGKSLKAKIESGPLQFNKAVDTAVQIAEGLCSAHKGNIIHRDVKSANVMITPDGQAKIMDFGLAKSPGRTQLTREGTTVGTVAYMSPEQTRGEEVDHRTDIWSLGIVLYEMISGQSPFKGDHEQAIVYSIVNEEPKPLTHLRTGVPLELERIVNKSLAKDPDERYQHVVDMRVDLANLQKSLAAWASGRASAVGPGPPRPATPAYARKKGFRRVAGLLLIVLVVIGAVWIFPRVVSRDDGERGGLPATSSGPSLGEHKASIAVLPLENLSGDEENEFFVDGMTEEIITQLAQISTLKVISRTSIMRYRDTSLPVATIAADLSVSTILEGSVLWAGDRVRINAQLIDGATDENLWANSYESDLNDVLGLQRRVAKDVAQRIRVQLTAQEASHLADSPTVNKDAYELYLKGRYWWNKRTPESIQKAIDFYEEALEIDPDYADAYAGIAQCHLVRGGWDHMTPPHEIYPSAREYAQKALSIDSNLASAHAVLGGVAYEYDWDWDIAESQLQRALEITPNDATAHQWYSGFLSSLDRHEEAVRHVERARELDPLSLIIIASAVMTYANADNPEKSSEVFQDGLDIDPNYPPLFWTRSYSYLHFGEFEKSAESSIRYLELYASNDIERAMAAEGKAVFEQESWRGFARFIVGYLKALYAARYAPPVVIAGYHATLDEADSSIVWLQRAYQVRGPGMTNITQFSAFGILYADPRFIELLELMNLTDTLDNADPSEGKR